MTVSHRTLKILTAAVWYVGGIVLLIKGFRLLMEAESLHPDQHWPWTAFVLALAIGGVKAKFIFAKSCRKNLARITALDQPKAWLFFRPVFFLFLLLMILTGATLSSLAHGNFPLLLGVAGLDLAIAVALLGSSYVFWKD